jgi:hypothetical protein
MRLSELFAEWDQGRYYLPKIHVYLRDYGLEEIEIKEVVGMLRGLANAIEGFNGVAGVYNDDAISEDKVRFRFSSVENATRFKAAIEKYFAEDVLEKIRAKKVHSAHQ